jgi:branched-chain amino acid transport system substrate-binding protein
MMKRRLRWLSLLLALVLVASACGSDGDSSDETTPDDSGSDSTEDSTADDGADEGTADDADGDAADDAEGDDAAAPTGDPIKIGSLTSLTGPFTSWGIHVSAGMQMAVDDINAAGGVDGRPLELVIVDDQSDAEEAVDQMDRLIEEGVIAVGGTISSGIGTALTAVAEDEQIPYFLSKSGSQAILTPDSRYTFRTCLQAGPMVADMWVQYAESEGFSKVGQVVADYAWGQAFKDASETAFDNLGIEYQTEVAPVPEQDYTTYLRALDDFGPDLLLAGGHPPGSGAILAQAADLGIDVNVAGAASSLTAVMEAAGDTAIGVYADGSCADYFSDSYAELAARYITDYDRTFMEDDAVSGYGVVVALAEAIGEVGEDTAAISEYLHANSFDTPGMAYPLAWTEWGELSGSTPVVVEVGAGPAPEGLNTAGDWWPVELFRTAPLEPYDPGA